MKRIMAIFICLTFVSMGMGMSLSHPTSAVAQSTPTPTLMPTPNSGTSTIFLIKGTRLVLWNPSTLQEIPYLNLIDQPGTELRDARIDPNSQFMYILDGSAGQLGVSGTNRVIRIDTVTKQRSVIFQGTDLIFFILSPDGQRAVVTYFLNGPGKDTGFCVLTITTGQCANNVNTGVELETIRWVDSQTFVAVLLADHSLYTVNANTGTRQKLPGLDAWWVHGVTVIPGTQSLLLGATRRKPPTPEPQKFLKFDLSTSQITQLPYNPPVDIYTAVTDLRLSPDGKYLLFRNGWGAGLLNFQNGHVIVQVNGVAQIEWLSDSRSVIAIVFIDGNTLKTIQIDPATGQTSQIANTTVGVVIPQITTLTVTPTLTATHTPTPTPTPLPTTLKLQYYPQPDEAGTIGDALGPDFNIVNTG